MENDKYPKLIIEVASNPKEVKEVVDKVKNKYNPTSGYLVGFSILSELETHNIQIMMPITKTNTYQETVMVICSSKETATSAYESNVSNEGITSVLDISEPIYDEFSSGEVILQFQVEKTKNKVK